MTVQDRKRLPTNMPTTNRPINLGRSMNDDTSRLDGIAKVSGQAKYGRDIYLDNQLFAAFIRCPFGSAELTSIDEAAARNVPGVIEISISGREGTYHGHNVGHIAAESKTALWRGMKAANAQWTRRPVKTQITDGADDPPAMNDAAQQAIADADHVLEATYSTPVQTHSSFETHGATIHQEGEHATCWISSQGTSAAGDRLDDALEIPQANIEVICEHVGGGFGSKLGGPGKEGLLAARICKQYNRPVSVFVDRAEEHLDTGNRPSSRSWVKVGFTNDGTILGGQIQTWGGVGVARSGGGVRFPSRRYNLGDMQKGRAGHQDVKFNAGGPRAMRAPGCPQGSFAEELMLDEIATIAGVDPVDLRTRLDSDADRREMYQLGAKLIGWNQRHATGSQKGVIRRGFGMGSTSWGRFGPGAQAEVVIYRGGAVQARTGTQDIGTGQRTAMAVVVSEYLGAPMAYVSVAIGRSSLPPGPGSGGSMTCHNTAPAMMAAAEDAKKQFLQSISGPMHENPDDLDIVDGMVTKNGEDLMDFGRAAKRMTVQQIVGRGVFNRQEGTQYIKDGHSHGAQFVDLQVDTETGVITVNRIVAIQSCGRTVCRKTAESQIIGGVIQGLSYALFENKLLDRRTGAMVNPNFEQYQILGSADMPHIEPVLWEKGQTGIRSLGEPPTVPTAGATACALFNAIGAPVRHLPLTPDKVLTAVEAAVNGGAA